MARGEDTSKHPNRQVGRGSIPPMSDEQRKRMYGGIKPNFPVQGVAQEWMDDPSKAPYLNEEVATFSPETLKEFGLDKDKD